LCWFMVYAANKISPGDNNRSITMNIRQKLQAILLILLILFTFATYREGNTVWLQWLSVACILSFMMVFDYSFTNESSFMFDPDADNWRRKTEALNA